MGIEALIAFAGGVLSLLSPCSALLLPAFFAYAFPSRGQLVLRTGVFYLGLLTLFIPLGVGLGAVGSLFLERRAELSILAGLLLIAIGSFQLVVGGFELPGAGRMSASRFGASGESLAATYTLGLVYGIGGFCSCPLLGVVLTIAGASGGALEGALLLAVFAAGIAAPLLTLALLWERLGTAAEVGPHVAADLTDIPTPDGQDHEPDPAQAARRRIRLHDNEGRLAGRHRRSQAEPLVGRSAEDGRLQIPDDCRRPLERLRVGRHRHTCIGSEELGKGRAVGPLPGVEIPSRNLARLGLSETRWRLQPPRRQTLPDRRARPLEAAVHRRRGRLERLGHLRGRPVEDVAQDKDRPLARRQELNCGKKCEPNSLPPNQSVRWIAVVPDVGEPGLWIGIGPAELVAIVGHRGSASSSIEEIEAGVRRDPVEPGSEPGWSIQPIEAPPRRDERFLGHVLGVIE